MGSNELIAYKIVTERQKKKRITNNKKQKDKKPPLENPISHISFKFKFGLSVKLSLSQPLLLDTDGEIITG